MRRRRLTRAARHRDRFSAGAGGIAAIGSSANRLFRFGSSLWKEPFCKTQWLIRKVYEADRLECPKCKGPMRVIALIEDPGVTRRILEHLGLWAPRPTERSPPVDPASWPPYVSLPLTLHPVPDIA